MNSDTKELFEWYKTVSEMIASVNNRASNWKEDLFVDFVLHKIRGYNFEKFNILNHLSNLELIKLIDEYEEEDVALMNESPSMDKAIEILQWLDAIRSEIDYGKNKSKSEDVRNHYLENAKRYTHYIEEILNK